MGDAAAVTPRETRMTHPAGSSTDSDSSAYTAEEVMAESVTVGELGARPRHDVVRCLFPLGDRSAGSVTDRTKVPNEIPLSLSRPERDGER